MAKSKRAAINEKWFKNKVQSSGLTQAQIAKVLKIAPPSLTLTIQGKRRLQIDEATALSGIFNCPMDEVLSNMGLDLSKDGGEKRTEIAGYIDGELAIHLGRVKGPKGAPSIPIEKGADVKVLRLQTSSSAFDGMDGALVYYRHMEFFDPESVGRVSIVQIDGEANFKLRIVKRGWESGRHNLALLNGTVKEENVIIKIAIPVIWMKF